MKKPLLFLIVLMTTVIPTFGAKPAKVPAYLDPTQPVEVRVEDALARMTLEEKVAMLHAQARFSSPGVPRLGIPEIWCSDGPHGIRAEVLWDSWVQAGWTNDFCTAFPALTALAATWDPELSHRYGVAIGEEAAYRKKTVLLGPGVNIYRTPLCGRNFEYMGEDPYLASKMCVPYIQGVQEQGVAACVKHFALNNQELNRHTSNVRIDERALYEIYLPAFEAAVREGKTWSIMGSYNLWRDQHCCHNSYLLNDILKRDWAFDGVVVSDWGGCHSTRQAIENGLDLEYGTTTDGLTSGAKNAYDNYYLADPYLKLLREGKADVAQLDEKVRRILRMVMRTTMNPKRVFGSFVSPEHLQAAREIGAAGIVLLKNDRGMLPLKGEGKILVVGENAIKPMTIGGGSSSLKVAHEVSPLDGLRAAMPHAEIAYERGYVGDTNVTHNSYTMPIDLTDNRSADELIAAAVAAAHKADCVIFIGGLNKSRGQDAESGDRKSFGLPYGQDRLIEALLEVVGDRLIVVNISGNAVAMPWVDRVSTLVQDWYLGSEAGNSLADVLTGAVAPSGKLPFTFPKALEDGPVRSKEQYPGIARGEGRKATWDVDYSEGIFVGYRWFEKERIAPMFPFGHGLSYTTFDYTSAKGAATMSGDRYTFTVTVRNSGSVAGAEVVQVYVRDDESSVVRPEKELKGFRKVWLEPGESRTLKFTLTRRDLSFYDADAHTWRAEAGTFKVMIGSSSADIRQEISFKLK